MRGMTPWPGAFSFHIGSSGSEPQRVTVFAVEAVPGDPSQSVSPGTVTEVTQDYFAVATGSGSLRILRLKPAGGRELSAAEYLHGHSTKRGDKFARIQ